MYYMRNTLLLSTSTVIVQVYLRADQNISTYVENIHDCTN